MRIRQLLQALTTLTTTIDPHIPAPWPARIRNTLDYINRHIDNALDNLRTSTPDGWGTSASGANIGTGSRSTGHTTTVEAAITGRLQFAGDNRDQATGRALGAVAVLDQLEALIRDSTTLLHQAIEQPDTARTRAQTANDHLKQACNIVDQWITHELGLKSLLTCACVNLDGWLEWGNPLCDNIAEPGRAGLCIPCERTREAWRVRRYREARKTPDQRITTMTSA